MNIVATISISVTIKHMLTRHETLKSLPSKSEFVNQDILKPARGLQHCAEQLQ